MKKNILRLLIIAIAITAIILYSFMNNTFDVKITNTIKQFLLMNKMGGLIDNIHIVSIKNYGRAYIVIADVDIVDIDKLNTLPVEELSHLLEQPLLKIMNDSDACQHLITKSFKLTDNVPKTQKLFLELLAYLLDKNGINTRNFYRNYFAVFLCNNIGNTDSTLLCYNASKGTLICILWTLSKDSGTYFSDFPIYKFNDDAHNHR